MCARRPTSAMPKPSLQPFRLVVAGCVSAVCRWWWCNVRWCGMWCHVVGCEVRWSNVVGCGVTRGEVMWLIARCHVMWCDVVSCQKWIVQLIGVLQKSRFLSVSHRVSWAISLLQFQQGGCAGSIICYGWSTYPLNIPHLRNKSLIVCLIKGNPIIFINPDHKANYF